MECIFCKIIDNQIPSFCFYEDDLVKVILDINPLTNGDSLIITKKHYENILDVDDETFKHIHKVIKDVYKIMQDKLNALGLTIIINNNYGQDIKHLHVHLTPRYESDELKTTSNKDNLKDLEVIYETMNKRD